MNITDEMYEAAIRRFMSERGKNGAQARIEKYTKEERGAQIKRGLKRKKKASGLVDNS